MPPWECLPLTYTDGLGFDQDINLHFDNLVGQPPFFVTANCDACCVERLIILMVTVRLGTGFQCHSAVYFYLVVFHPFEKHLTSCPFLMPDWGYQTWPTRGVQACRHFGTYIYIYIYISPVVCAYVVFTSLGSKQPVSRLLLLIREVFQVVFRLGNTCLNDQIISSYWNLACMIGVWMTQ